MSKRQLAWIVAALSLVAFALAVRAMGIRIGAFNEQARFPRFHAEPVVAREFELHGWPRGVLADFTDELGRSFLKLDYGGKQTLIPVKTPPAKDVPNLSVYDEWAKVVAFSEVQQGPDGRGGASMTVPGSQRLWIVTRNTPMGYDPDKWGSVRRAEWVFRFYELGRDGTVEVVERRWPRGYRGEEFLQKHAALAAQGKGEAEDARYAELAKIEPLKERSAEYYAAMFVIPKINVPQYKFEDTALQFRVLGWTIPVAGFSVLGMILGCGFGLAPKGLRTEPPSQVA